MAIVTGSRAYGTPTEKSDIDLVVLVTPAEVSLLLAAAGQQPDKGSGGRAVNASIRFGALNLLCVTDPVEYEMWCRGTRELKRAAPVSRTLAVKMFTLLEKHCGIGKEYPTVSIARESLSAGF